MGMLVFKIFVIRQRIRESIPVLAIYPPKPGIVFVPNASSHDSPT